VTETAVERLDPEDPAMVVHVLVDDLRDLKVHFSSSQEDSLFQFAFRKSRAFYFE